jgi:hypothetical protein
MVDRVALSFVFLPVLQHFPGGIIPAVLLNIGARGGVVVKALRYKPAGSGLYSRFVIGIFQ